MGLQVRSERGILFSAVLRSVYVASRTSDLILVLKTATGQWMFEAFLLYDLKVMLFVILAFGRH